ncbi:MAG TPA: hypothetical protein VF572_01985 [Candidatus Saccharimonadales bacterium]|jgi:hypothetical protein
MERYLPTEPTLQYFAQQCDAERVRATLAAIEQADVPDEFYVRLDSLDARLGVIGVFKRARQGLAELEDAEPDCMFPDADTPPETVDDMVAELPEQAEEYEAVIRAYVNGIRNDISGVPADRLQDRAHRRKLVHIDDSLADIEAQPVALKYLQSLPDASGSLIVQNAEDTVEDIVETIWEIPLTGRETVMYVADKPEAAVRYLQNWKATADESFDSSSRQLAAAIDWLEGDA